MIALPGIAIQTKIYESSASVVYRGIRVSDDRPIVVKLLKQDYPSVRELTCYRQEYEITRSLDLEGVVKAYSQQDYQRSLAIVLEDFGGESLEYWLRHRPETFRPMPLAPFLHLAIDLADILGKIHAANIVHKDINPSNIVLNPDTGVVKVIDFGIATRFHRTNPTFKSPHELEGTLAYLSPEQTGRMNRSLDYRSDFYSLGVTFYELLTGQLPFETTDILELVHCHIAKPPMPLAELNAAIPTIVSDIVLKLMAKNAEDRYQSAWGIKADLAACLRQFAATQQIDSMPLGRQDISDRFQVSQKLYGRDAEIAAILAAFVRVACPEDNRVVGAGSRVDESGSTYRELMLVSGCAGIGKSALVQELYQPITAKRGYFVSGKFDLLQRNVPYRAIASALQKLVRQLLGEPEEQVQQWRSQLLAALGNNGQIIIDVIPEVELIIGKQPPLIDVGATEAQNRFDRVFVQFIRVFCVAEHPLVIFLDDLQWADSATLRSIELMMTDAQTQYLFLIGTYRDNEVNAAHPLMMTLEALRKGQATLSQITLAPLASNAIAQLIADTLHSDMSNVSSLAELAFRKTGGNPFFVNVFLKTLDTENLLRFDVDRLSWQWDIDRIESKGITDNVAELMLDRLQNLPLATQEVLQFAACIGSDFDLDTLSIVCERSPSEIFLELVTAVRAGLIVPISELDERLLVRDYRFLHDRLQQAAYAPIDESQQHIVHLQIGRNLLETTLPERIPDRLFEIVDRLNHGIELVFDRAERDEIARLNLLAAQKAKGAIAYDVTKKYLIAGRSWLATSSWQNNYDLTLELYSETTVVAFLCGDFEEVATWSGIVVQNAKTVLDRVKVYEIEVQTYMAQNQILEAIQTALQVLQQLGVSLPEQPSWLDVEREIDTSLSYFGKMSVENSIDLTEMTDPNKLATMRILSRISAAATIVDPNLRTLIASKLVNLSIEYGIAPVSPCAYANFGITLCGITGNIELGYQLGRLALRLLSRPSTQPLKAQTLLMVNLMLVHWKEHNQELLEPLLAAYQSGLETGDSEFASYSACTYSYQCFIIGQELVEVEREMERYEAAIHQLKQAATLSWHQINRQFILNLRGNSIDPTYLIGESYNEAKKLSEHEASNNGIAIFNVYLNKLILCYLFSQYDRAVEYSTRAEPNTTRIIATPSIPLFYFYDSLARLGTYFENLGEAQSEILNKVAASQEKMQQWADRAPMNYLHKYHLIEAEKARVLGQLLEAEEFYERAIQGAKDNGYLQEEALAYELAAKFYLDRGRVKFAQTYMKEAHYCYERWGATAKVQDLEARYPELLPPSTEVQIPIAKASKTTSNRSPIAFDLAAVMKASQAISSEIELDRLLGSLMQISIENAGAQTGFLILENLGEWTIESSCELDDSENVCTTTVLQSIPIANQLPESIINYVIRTRETVILNDATCEGNFINEPYIQSNQTRSLLCLPLLNQTKLVGVLYLENQLTAGAFTPERSQVLHLLSTQAAIAIENAKLYAKLRASESQMTQFLEAVPVGIGVVDANGRPYYANRQAIQLLDKGIDPVTPDRMAGAYQLYLAGTDRPYPTENLPAIRALLGERTRIDDLEIHQDNARIPVEAWGTPIYDEQGNVVYAIAAFQDITERKQVEQLRRAEATLILEERNRMAREIHDTLAQAFTSIIVHLDAISQRLTVDPDAAQSHLKTARTLARSGLADARRSVEALRPQILEEGDLSSALDRFSTQMFAHTTVRVVCETFGEPYPLPQEVESNLLRIGQEALTNAFKYANASEVRIELRYEASQCSLQIRDNGQGFESSSLTVGRGFGLLGMTERVERIGAKLTIESQLGRGTDIIARIQRP
jgi:PAS domain S-box-containing protein